MSIHNMSIPRNLSSSWVRRENDLIYMFIIEIVRDAEQNDIGHSDFSSILRVATIKRVLTKDNF